MAHGPPTRTSSDPGPRYEDEEWVRFGLVRATQNSDDGPLAGEPSSMSRQCSEHARPQWTYGGVHGGDGEDEDEGEEQESGSEDYGHAEAIAAAYR